MTFDSRWKNPQGKNPEEMYLWAQNLVKELRKGDFFSTQVGDGITNAQLADMAAWTIKARNNSATGAPEDVDRADLTAAAAPGITHELFGFLSTNELRRVPTTIVGGLQLLNSGTMSDDATLDIVLTNFTGYRALKFLLSSFVPATDDVELWVRFSTDGGSSYDATGYSYATNGLRSTSSTNITLPGSAQNQIRVAGTATATQSISNVAAEGGVDVEVTLHNQAVSRYSGVRYHSCWTAGGGEIVHTIGGGRRTTQQDTNAVQFLFESGNITSGDWALYGYV